MFICMKSVIKLYTRIILQALHITDVLHKSVNELKAKIEENAKSRVHTDRQLTRMIVELDDVSSVSVC